GKRQQLEALPSDDLMALKPGHWASVRQPARANNFNFNGDLLTAATDSSGRPLNLERTLYRLQMTRPAALPKGQTKQLESLVFVPRREGRQGNRPWVLSRLRSRGGGSAIEESFAPALMEPFQHFLVVLARKPDTYAYLKTDLMHTIRPPRGGFGGPATHYRVVLAHLEKQAPLADNPLLWTTTACVLWDDVDPDLLTLDQQESLVDWLHWGGTLVISGPGSLETLKNSFLADYLPAAAGEAAPLEQSRFDELNAAFTLPGEKGERKPLTVVTQKPPEGVRLNLRDGSQFVPLTGGLVAERQVGRGRVVATSFALTSPQIMQWRNFDGFFNGVLLR
ncbi:MAG: hypothetical protein KDA41_18735, partial [Planctomycetales bacterium]|nr:hypothetical protein [Planctomycetales bacterium]